MREIDYGFTRVDIDVKQINSKRKESVWINRKTAKEGMKRINISGDLIESLKWREGDRLELQISRDGRTLAFKRVNHIDSFRLKKNGRNFLINSSALAIKIFSSMRCAYKWDIYDYEAKTIDDFIIFYPSKEKRD